MGKVLEVGVAQASFRHPSIGEVRGLGLFWGLELVRDRASRRRCSSPSTRAAKLRPRSAASARRLWAKGLSLMTHWNVAIVAAAADDHAR